MAVVPQRTVLEPFWKVTALTPARARPVGVGSLPGGAQVSGGEDIAGSGDGSHGGGIAGANQVSGVNGADSVPDEAVVGGPQISVPVATTKVALSNTT